MKTYVLYHAHCADGFGAAFAAWCALGPSAEYIPVQYGDPMPPIPDGARVFIVDFSYPDNARAREELCALAERTTLTVIDHHKTAQAALEGLPFAIFDMEKSGAVLAWEYFRAQPDPCSCFGPVPELMEYIQDRDLWRWHLPGSPEVSAGLTLEPRTFARWAEILNAGGHGISDLWHAGQTVLKRDQNLVASICAKAHVHALYAGGEGEECRTIDVIAVNTPVLQSEACHELLQRHPDQEIVGAYFQKDWRTRVWSLRSRPGCDCSVIAKANGGGGHAQASGFTVED